MNAIAEAVSLLGLLFTMLGFFTTVPAPAQAQGPVTTVVAFADVAGPGNDGPAPAYAQGAQHAPNLVLQLGDFDHRNPCFSGIATTCRNRARIMYQAVRTCASGTGALISGCDWAAHLAGFPLIHVRDDHDGILGTWSHGITSGCPSGGYGVIKATTTTLTLEARGEDGALRHTLTLTR